MTATIALPTVAAMVDAFSRMIRETLTSEQLAAVRAGAASVDDFCDSNQLMIDAAEELAPGFEEIQDSGSAAQADWITDVWTIALANGYGEPIPLERQILALELFNPIAEYTIEADDIDMYMQVAKEMGDTPSIENFRAWLYA